MESGWRVRQKQQKWVRVHPWWVESKLGVYYLIVSRSGWEVNLERVESNPIINWKWKMSREWDKKKIE